MCVCVCVCPVVLVGTRESVLSFEVTVRIWGPLLEVVMQLNSWGEGLCRWLFFFF